MEETLFTVTECEDIVRKCLQSENVQTLRFVVVRLQNQNFLLKVTVNHNSEEKTLNFFAKSSLNKPQIIDIFFDNFKKTIPKFDEKITPKFFYGKSDLLLFEDLTWQGFHCHLNFFTLRHVEVVLKTLAKFHAGSFAFEEIKSREVGNYRLDQDYNLVNFVVDVKTNDLCELLEDKSEENLMRVSKNLEERQLENKFRRTLCHANLIPQNIMFKCQNEEPEECKLINFSSKHYAPPICDVLQLIFFNTTENLRQCYFEDLLNYYYNCLEKELEHYSLKIEDILPEKDWQIQAHTFLPLIKLQTYLLYKNKMIEELKEDLNCPILSRQDCYTIIRNKIKSTNYKLLNFRVTPLDEANGYLGTYQKLQIKIETQIEETINCFVKCMPKNTSSKCIVEETGCFFKELFIYQTLVPQLEKLGINTISDCLPKCYFQRSEDLVVFEDISSQNYRSLPAQIPFDISLLTIVIKKLAKFHASTLVFEEKKSEELKRKYRIGEEYKDFLYEIFFLKEEKHRGALVMQTGVRSTIDVINLFPELKTKKNEDNFIKLWPKLEELFWEVIKPSKQYRNVVSHGDLWTNNIMVKIEDNKPIDCCFVDYQCTRYCPPAHDCLSIIYLTTDRVTRSKHEQELILLYYEEFAKILTLYGYNPQEILSFEEFLETISMIKPQMVVQATMWFTFVTCTSEEISSILANEETCHRVFFEDRKDYLKVMCEKSPIFKKKLKECVLDLYDLCNSLVL